MLINWLTNLINWRFFAKPPLPEEHNMLDASAKTDFPITKGVLAQTVK
jgi:hypothetical protein